MLETEPSEKNVLFDSMMVYFTPAKVGCVQPLTKQTARPAKLMGQGDYLYYRLWGTRLAVQAGVFFGFWGVPRGGPLPVRNGVISPLSMGL